MDRIEVKTPENQLKQEFIQGCGFPPKIADSLVGTVNEYVRTNYGDLHCNGQTRYTAVAKDEPAGKPLKECRLVCIELTTSTKGDRKVKKEQGVPAALHLVIA